MGGGVSDMQRKRQSGSTLVFVICAIVLVLVACAVLYGVRRAAVQDQVPPMNIPEGSGSVQEPSDQSSQDSSDTRGPTEDDTNGSSADTDNTTSNGSSSSDSLSTGEGTGEDGEVDQQHLPTTGPEDTFVSATILAIMTAATVAYIRSRTLV